MCKGSNGVGVGSFENFPHKIRASALIRVHLAVYLWAGGGIEPERVEVVADIPGIAEAWPITETVATVPLLDQIVPVVRMRKTAELADFGRRTAKCRVVYGICAIEAFEIVEARKHA